MIFLSGYYYRRRKMELVAKPYTKSNETDHEDGECLHLTLREKFSTLSSLIYRKVTNKALQKAKESQYCLVLLLLRNWLPFQKSTQTTPVGNTDVVNQLIGVILCSMLRRQLSCL